jgi:hypothetical protein
MGRTGFDWLRTGPVASVYGYGNELSGSSRLFFDNLSDYRLFK